MNILFKKLDEKAVIPFKTFERDFCFDCVATSKEYIGENKIKYGLGFALQFDGNDDVYKGAKEEFIFSFDFRPRSSIHKTGLILCNSTGTGDENYTGEYQLFFYRFDKSLPEYEIGDRIAQMKVGFNPKIEFTEVNELKETDRGALGFGGTGK